MDRIDRRATMQAGMALILAGVTSARPAWASTEPQGRVTGKGIGDFDFLAGEWRISNRRLKDGSVTVWEEFEGGATVHRVMAGQASIEELRANGKVLGMGVRVWHPEQQMWADHWTGVWNGVVNDPQMGRFVDGAGVFGGEAEEGETERWRGIWDEIAPTSCRWRQQVSRDAGKSWTEQWVMHWVRA